MGRLTEEVGPMSGSNAIDTGPTFLRLFRETAPFQSPFTMNIGIRRTYFYLKPAGPHGEKGEGEGRKMTSRVRNTGTFCRHKARAALRREGETRGRSVFMNGSFIKMGLGSFANLKKKCENRCINVFQNM